ncbi:protein TolQ [Roseobacter sp. CCS2]|uniref:protein TolQ n=1 Tax=Roseobacter sp. CCS2 TaxID=391593 RepID=UPI0000F40161|nr:protein TolQ [Roseobacter sp. CCS2]EBA13326.1 proton transporter TolQ [Roseobacter sp. CCS2]
MEAAQEFTMWALFARATITVKIVMIMLVAASVWCWAVIIDKTIQYRKARAEADVFDRSFWSGEPLDALFDQIGADPDGQSEKIFASGMLEWRRSHRQDGGLIAGATARIDRSMDVAIAKQASSLQKGLPILATVGSTAPFVGLFGTVWGIMNAFIEIAEAQTTNLAVVAPGIAEALLATGLGLLAAIPAVIYYNKFSADSDQIVSGYEAFADEFATILSRQLDS